MTVSTTTAAQAEMALMRSKPDGETDPAGEAGWFLERERTNRDISLDDACEATGIHTHHLSAIEFGDLTGLPHRKQALQMIGAYAKFLGFDPQPLVLHYAQFLPKDTEGDKAKKTKIGLPRPLGSAAIIPLLSGKRFSDFAGGAGGIVASIGAAVAVFGLITWALLPGESSTNTKVAGAVSPDVMQQQSDRTPVASISRATETELPDDQAAAEISADGDLPELSGLDALIERELGIKPRKSAGEQAAAAGDATIAGEVKITTEGRVYGLENEDARLVIRALDDVWFRIEDSKGNVVVTKTLKKGDRYRVPPRPGLIVISRDGGRLEYAIDGKVQGSLGLPGEILVGNPIDIDKLAKTKS